MEHSPQPHSEPTLIFDTFDIDLVVKVLSHTVFSESRLEVPPPLNILIRGYQVHSFSFFSLSFSSSMAAS